MNVAEDEFTAFVRRVEPSLRRALVAGYGVDRGRDAAMDALVFAWRRWDKVRGLENPAGYLFRVGQRVAKKQRETTLGWGESESWPVAVGGTRLVGRLGDADTQPTDGCGFASQFRFHLLGDRREERVVSEFGADSRRPGSGEAPPIVGGEPNNPVDRPGVVVARPGQLHPLPTEHPPPAGQHLYLRVVELVGTSGTIGEGGEEVTVRVGEGDAGNELGTIEVVKQVRCTLRTIRWA